MCVYEITVIFARISPYPHGINSISNFWKTTDREREKYMNSIKIRGIKSYGNNLNDRARRRSGRSLKRKKGKKRLQSKINLKKKIKMKAYKNGDLRDKNSTNTHV